MQEAGYEIKTGKYISFRAAGQERFTRAKTIGENYTEERIKERIAGRNPRKRRMQIERKGIWQASTNRSSRTSSSVLGAYCTFQLSRRCR